MTKRFDSIELEKLVENGDVAKRKHPTKNLYIYSYLKTWYPEWSETLRWARGLILDGQGNVVACPFKKFFNYSEIKAEIDDLIRLGVPCRIQEKLDGSLGVLFWYDGEWHLSTKGSFTSEQAIKGKEILEKYYPSYTMLDKAYTYLFEIIYPENQIVVQYKEEQLVLLAIMDPISMEEVDPKSVYIPALFDKVQHYPALKVSEIIKDMSRPDYCSSEGFVVVYDDETRVKFKYDEYVKLHKIVSDFKPQNVIELMKEGGNVDELIQSLPDEFRTELIEVKERTEKAYTQICLDLFTYFYDINSPDKRTFALKAVQHPLKALLFDVWKYYHKELGWLELTIQWAKTVPSLNKMMYDKILEDSKEWVLYNGKESIDQGTFYCSNIPENLEG